MWQHVISYKPFVSRYAGREEAACTGKWLVTFPLRDPDDLWEHIVKAATHGDIIATKCSGPRLDAILGHHLACVYCPASDEATVAQTLAVLRDLGVSGPLNYKTDLATVEGREDYLWTSEQIEKTLELDM